MPSSNLADRIAVLENILSAEPKRFVILNYKKTNTKALELLSSSYNTFEVGYPRDKSRPSTEDTLAFLNLTDDVFVIVFSVVDSNGHEVD